MASSSKSKANNGFFVPSHATAMAPGLLLLLIFFFLLVDASAAAASSSHQQLQAQQMQVKRARSLLQAPKIDCVGTCSGRCANNWKKELCNKMCNVCCNRCNCVPPGRGQDTRHLCPCYDTMVNPHNGKLKCP
uniref:Uncharacterized protein n=1 Tax=Oryza punctata TaxID=4537 RepID=A0A0E0LFY1_ORYPU